MVTRARAVPGDPGQLGTPTGRGRATGHLAAASVWKPPIPRPLTIQVVHVLDVCFGGRLHGRLPLLPESPRHAGKRKRAGGTGGSGGSASSSGPQTRQRTRVLRD